MAKGWNSSPARVYQASDDAGLQVWIEVNFNTNTLAIVNPGVNVHRDPGCHWDILVLGLDEIRGRNTFTIPEGDTSVTRGQLNGVGYTTVQDITNAGITFESSAG